MQRLSQIQIRDPFVLPVPEERRYHLFGTTDENCWGPVGTGFDAYRSNDLEKWEGPLPAFRPPEGFWATRHFWAPEVHPYGGRYYMFASFKADEAPRGTQILVAERPEGPYRPHSDGCVTPPAWECLDGTLHQEKDGQPWMVFCHEWVQITDGAIAAIPLNGDLSGAAGEATTLFAGSEAAWSVGSPEAPGRRVTDGPWLHRTEAGKLLLLWSTTGVEGYTLGYAVSETGHVTGPWSQHPEPLFRKDGGHGMIFRTFDGQLMLTLHQPNRTRHERARFFPLRETPTGLLELTNDDAND